MSLRAAKRNASLATNYGLPALTDERVMRRAREGAIFRPQQPSALAQRQLEKLLSNGERIAAEKARAEQELTDGNEAKDHDRVVVGEREALPYNPFAI